MVKEKKVRKVIITDRMQKVLRKTGPLQVIDLTKHLNEDTNFKSVNRNTINTLLYTSKMLFKKVGFGRFDVIDGSKADIREEVFEKIIILIEFYQQKFERTNLSWNPELFGVEFTSKELKIMEEIKKKLKDSGKWGELFGKK